MKSEAKARERASTPNGKKKGGGGRGFFLPLPFLDCSSSKEARGAPPDKTSEADFGLRRESRVGVGGDEREMNPVGRRRLDVLMSHRRVASAFHFSIFFFFNLFCPLNPPPKKKKNNERRALLRRRALFSPHVDGRTAHRGLCVGGRRGRKKEKRRRKNAPPPSSFLPPPPGITLLPQPTNSCGPQGGQEPRQAHQALKERGREGERAAEREK